MVSRYARGFFQNSEFISITFLQFKLNTFLSPNTTEVYREYVSCTCNSSYRFKPILLKLLQVLLGWAEDTLF